ERPSPRSGAEVSGPDQQRPSADLANGRHGIAAHPACAWADPVLGDGVVAHCEDVRFSSSEGELAPELAGLGSFAALLRIRYLWSNWRMTRILEARLRADARSAALSSSKSDRVAAGTAAQVGRPGLGRFPVDSKAHRVSSARQLPGRILELRKFAERHQPDGRAASSQNAHIS